MQTRHHPLPGATPGTLRRLTSFHYGPPDGGRKAYVQASLHADELPGMLVAHHLRRRLATLEEAGRLKAEVVVVPVANPIGLGQSVLRRWVGRFELASGQNFNRHYPSLLEPVSGQVAGRLGDDAEANAAIVRAAMREALAALPALDEGGALRRTLLGLACDAEVVLDLHCDSEALVHLYTGTPLWPQCEPLARLIGARATLLAQESGDNPFDEACSQTWWQLRERFPAHPLPLGCLSVTVELRGERDVAHDLAEADADALIAFLTLRGFVDGPAPALPPLLNEATALDATEVVASPATGLVAYGPPLGERLRAGDRVADVIDPLTGEVHPVRCSVDGLLLTRESQRLVTAGRPLVKVVGTQAVRKGKLSSD